MTHTFKRQAVVQALAGILFFLGNPMGPRSCYHSY